MSSIFKFNFFKAGAYLWRTRNAPIVPIPKENAFPLFKGTPAFIARYALVFLSMDVMYMTTMVYECWEGGQLYHNPLKQINPQKQSVEDSTPPQDPTSVTPAKSQKPMWTRVAFGAFHCGLGGLIAAFLLSQRASWVRSMTLVRPLGKKAQPPQLYIEVAGHPNDYAHPFLLKDCKLASTEVGNDIMMVVVKEEGKFAFRALGATVAGKPMPPTGDQAVSYMLKTWIGNGGEVQRKKQKRT
ncbi:hypothetical protein CPC08DRAFT_747018 [Agrocybe pediades]|nr:hypothetical protein CPC08DRAFT_747018 [Agrocybe pediades]